MTPATATTATAGPPVEKSAPQDASVRLTWAPWALGGLLVVTAVLYLWNLSANRFGNDFYTAAAWAGSQNWKAWFFGALDPGNIVTVDKPPAAMWVTGLSVRLFGLNSWAVLAPEALMGVASVALLYCTMRRVFANPRHGTAAGLIAGAVLAFTPAAAMMFPFNNPDALLVLLMVGAAYATTRAIATNSGRWLAGVGVLLGFAFLTKMLQGLLVLPAFGLAYLLCANNSWLRRIGQLVVAAVALVVSAGWYVLITILVPATSRPYIGGSSNNSFMDLVWGYNGLGRINGNEAFGNRRGGGPGFGYTGAAGGPTAAPGGPGGGAGFGGPGGFGGGRMGPPGGGRGGMFGEQKGLSRLFSSEMGNEISWLMPVAIVVLLFAVYLAIRSVPRFGFTEGLSRNEFGALVIWGGWFLVTWLIFSYMSGIIHPYYTVALGPAIGALVGLGSVFAWRRRHQWDGRMAIAAMIVAAVVWAIVLLARNGYGPLWCRWLLGVVGAVAVVAFLLGSVLSWRKATVVALAVGALAAFTGTFSFAIATSATPHTGSIPNAVNTSMAGGNPFGGFGGGHGPGAGDRRPGGFGGMGGGSDNTELIAMLKATHTKWAAATISAMAGASYQLPAQKPVMSIGGFSGGDPAPTLQQFIDYVRRGQITYFIGGGFGPGRVSQIATWVEQHYTPTTVGTATVYKLT